ncbi:sigma-70 family RNA polymerase sigma factor [Paenibacillus herberti]|nr:sigma-70 family RNA polymerase sigma factor [Paenibacillus herberti]
MEDTVNRAAAGDRAAWEELAVRSLPLARAAARSRLRDAALAEDAVQEALLEAFLNLHKLREAEAFPGWLGRIVERQCWRQLRKLQAGTVSYEEQQARDDGAMPLPEQAVRSETAQLVRESLAALPPGQRLAAELFYLEGYSLKELSSYLDRPEAVLRKRLFDARRKLRSALPLTDAASVIQDLYGRNTRMLHIVNGDFVGDKLRKYGLEGDILVWREVYSFGPVSERLIGEGVDRKRRAAYLEKTFGIPQAEYLEGCKYQEEKLEAYREQKGQIILWFEHDLFDQAMLAALLHRLSEWPDAAEGRISLLCIGEYPGVEPFLGLGQLSSEQLGRLSGSWSQVSRRELELGRELWRAYTAATPLPMQQLLDGDLSPLPYAAAAFKAHLSRLPSMQDGLGIEQRTTLELLREFGPMSPLELFGLFGPRLHQLGSGDLQYWHILRGMLRGEAPLLQMEGESALPLYKEDSSGLERNLLKVTEQGLAALEGRFQSDAADRLRDEAAGPLLSITMDGEQEEEWLGGVRLSAGKTCWLWDLEQQRTIEMEADN